MALCRRSNVKTLIALLALLTASNLCSGQGAGQQGFADRIVVRKSARTMELLRAGKVLRTYKVALGGSPVGPKMRQGDHKTPEGLYRIDARNPHSAFYKSLHVSYPNASDRDRARKMGVSPGGDIMIHGLPPRYAFVGTAQSKMDWTDGCIAVSNSEMDEVWRLVPIGTPVEIKP